jgi:hypothetical protein
MIATTASPNTFAKNDYVTIGGVRGLDAANGTYRITPISPTQFALNGTEAGLGSYAGGGTAALLDPGQNNEGYSSIDISSPPNLDASSAGEVPHDYLDQHSLAALEGSGPGILAENSVTAPLNVRLPLRFTAYSSGVHTEQAQMLLYDGDPAAPGSFAIAEMLIHPGENGPDGSSVWFNWTPTTTGHHDLYAVLLEGGETQVAAELKVDVVAPR